MTEYLNISLNNDASIDNDIRAVCKDITDYYKILIPSEPPLGFKPLFVVHNPSTPITFVNGLPNFYSIGLTTNERFYAQIAYQFAHELTHIYCDPRVTNWFIESVCEMASLYFLDYLSNKWLTDPPYPDWISYASKYRDYKEKRVSDIFKHFNINSKIQFEHVFTNEIRTLNIPDNRVANTIVAIKLLEVFNQNENAWRIIPKLGQATDKILHDKSFFNNSIPNFTKLVELVNDNEKGIANILKNILK